MLECRFTGEGDREAYIKLNQTEKAASPPKEAPTMAQQIKDSLEKAYVLTAIAVNCYKPLLRSHTRCCHA